MFSKDPLKNITPHSFDRSNFVTHLMNIILNTLRSTKTELKIATLTLNAENK